MALPIGIIQREYDKFRESPGSRVAIGIVNAENFEINDVEKNGNTTRYGQENIDGIWLVRKIVKTTVGAVISTNILYASVKTNPLVTTYDAAWAARTTLTYGKYSGSM
jgi:hypothetical protein